MTVEDDVCSINFALTSLTNLSNRSQSTSFRRSLSSTVQPRLRCATKPRWIQSQGVGHWTERSLFFQAAGPFVPAVASQFPFVHAPEYQTQSTHTTYGTGSLSPSPGSSCCTV